MQSIGKYISRKKLEQLLNSVKADGNFTDTDIPHEPFDFNCPHFFSKKDKPLLNELTDCIAQEVSMCFGSIFNGDFDTKVTFRESYAHIVFQDKNDFNWLTFSTDNRPVGALNFTFSTGKAWAGQLFGEDSDDADQETETDLTELEASLINDIAVKVLNSFVSAANLQNAAIDEKITPQPPQLQSADFLELAIFELITSKKDDETTSSFNFIITSDNLAGIIGKNVLSENIDRNRASEAILRNFEKMPISVTSDFGYANLSFEEAMNLQTGDVILMEKNVDQPLDIKLADRVILKGTPASCEGKYAVTITEVLNH